MRGSGKSKLKKQTIMNQSKSARIPKQTLNEFKKWGADEQMRTACILCAFDGHWTKALQLVTVLQYSHAKRLKEHGRGPAHRLDWAVYACEAKDLRALVRLLGWSIHFPWLEAQVGLPKAHDLLYEKEHKALLKRLHAQGK